MEIWTTQLGSLRTPYRQIGPVPGGLRGLHSLRGPGCGRSTDRSALSQGGGRIEDGKTALARQESERRGGVSLRHVLATIARHRRIDPGQGHLQRRHGALRNNIAASRADSTGWGRGWPPEADAARD